MATKQCFENAYDLACDDPAQTYVEGLACLTTSVVVHAWCIDQGGLVVDPTWASLDGDPCARRYLGIAYAPMFLLRHQGGDRLNRRRTVESVVTRQP
ncbi:MAG: hypothetical protein WCP28_16595 [Actinomycetes bacterium]